MHAPAEPASPLPNLILTPDEQELVDTGKVLIVHPQSPEIPEEHRQAIRRGFSGSFGTTGLAATIQRSDGNAVIVVAGHVEDSVVRHEFIHAAQCFASRPAMEVSLASAISQGRSIAEAIDSAVAADDSLEETHRDLSRIRKAWEVSSLNPAAPNAFILFETLQSYYPTQGTAQLAAELGFTDPDGVYACLTAYVAHSAGTAIDPEGNMAREIVAYTFQARPNPCIDQLFQSALANLSPSLPVTGP